MIRLIDQTRAIPFFVQTGGPQPATLDHELQRAVAERLAAGDRSVLDDESLFPAPSWLPRDVQAPPGWRDRHALVLTAKPSGSYVLANLLPTTRVLPAELRGSWCVWDRQGTLRRHCDPALDGERLIDVDWAGSHLLELHWSGDPACDDYLVALVSADDGREHQHARFDIDWAANVRLSAQSLQVLRAPAHWLVWAASGHGEAGFDVIEIDESGPRRRLGMSDRYGEPSADVPPVLSPDCRWLAFACSEGTVIADLATGSARIMPYSSEPASEPA